MRTKEEADTILGFVRDNAAKLLGTEPQVFPVSAYAAMQAKLSAAPGDAGGSGDPPRGGVAEYSAPAAFASLEEYVKTTLSDVEKVRVSRGVYHGAQLAHSLRTYPYPRCTTHTDPPQARVAVVCGQQAVQRLLDQRRSSTSDAAQRRVGELLGAGASGPGSAPCVC